MNARNDHDTVTLWTSGVALFFMALVLWMLAANAVSAAERVNASDKTPAPIAFHRQDLSGAAVKVPDEKRPTLLLFVMPEQDRSLKAMEHVKQLLAQTATGTSRLAEVQVLAIVSGEQAPVLAPRLVKEAQWPWPVLVDADYQIAALANARVWPSTEVLDKAGQRLAHIAGLPNSYLKDLEAHLDFAAGKLDRAALEQRLNSLHRVASSSEQIASRHLQMALRLLEQKQVELARKELDKGLQAQPGEGQLLLALARVHLLEGQPQASLQILDKIDGKNIADWQLAALRGRTLVALKRWDEARPVLEQALKLNPEPAEVHYFLGRVFEHAQDQPRALASYRAAYEHSPAGRTLAEQEKAAVAP